MNRPCRFLEIHCRVSVRHVQFFDAILPSRWSPLYVLTRGLWLEFGYQATEAVTRAIFGRGCGRRPRSVSRVLNTDWETTYQKHQLWVGGGSVDECET
jgi:hypothetical protein